jgi:hypothetical protein
MTKSGADATWFAGAAKVMAFAFKGAGITTSEDQMSEKAIAEA